MSQLKEDHALLIEIVREGGALALSYFHGGVKHWDKGYGAPVSAADHAVDDFLRQKLLDHRPQYGWLSEETEDDSKRLGCRDVWVVDPIDGTRGLLFAARSDGSISAMGTTSSSSRVPGVLGSVMDVMP